MSSAAQKRMTVPEFVAWTGRPGAAGRFELVDGAPVAMAPERARHARTKLAVAMALVAAIRRAGLRCTAFPDGMTVAIDEHTAYEPDALVHCGAPIADDSVIVPDPAIVVEIASPGTRAIDAGVKLAGYFKLPSVAHYLIVDPERRLVVHHRRSAGGTIATAIVNDGALSLDPPGLELQVQELFAAP